MNPNKLKNLLGWLMLVIACSSAQVFAQVTTASISGLITDNKGTSLPGATVVATHTPSGTKYGTVTRDDGRFNLPNVRIGGPYSLEITFVGYDKSRTYGIMLAIAQKLNLDVQLNPITSSAGEVTVTADANAVMNKDGRW